MKNTTAIGISFLGISLILFMISALLFSLGSKTVNQRAEVFTVSDVVASLDRHELTEEREKFFELIFAYDGRAYNVQPGKYALEIYTYKATALMESMAEVADKVNNQVHIEGNTLLVLHTTDKAALDRLLTDLRD